MKIFALSKAILTSNDTVDSPEYTYGLTQTMLSLSQQVRIIIFPFSGAIVLTVAFLLLLYKATSIEFFHTAYKVILSVPVSKTLPFLYKGASAFSDSAHPIKIKSYFSGEAEGRVSGVFSVTI